MGVLRADRFGCFGKLPVSREFLVDGGRELSDSRLDRWIGEGLGLLKARLGPRFDSLVGGFPVYGFAWNAGAGGKLLAGRMRPSEDAAGRKHPFAVFACLDGRRASSTGPLLALALLEVHEVAGRLLEAAAGMGTPGQVADAVRAAQGGLPDDSRGLGETYHRFLTDQTGGDLWSGFFGDRASPLRHHVMQAFVETLAPLRGRDLKDIRTGIRFPLSAGDRARTALEVSFWIDLTGRFLGRGLERTSCFWAVEASNGRRPGLHLFFSEPSGVQWTCLADPDADIETVSFLDRPYGGDPERRMEAPLRQLMDSPDAPLLEYIRWVGRG